MYKWQLYLTNFSTITILQVPQASKRHIEIPNVSPNATEIQSGVITRAVQNFDTPGCNLKAFYKFTSNTKTQILLQLGTRAYQRQGSNPYHCLVTRTCTMP